MRREGRGHRARGRHSLAVPILNGAWALHANNLWQCQRSAAKALPGPIIFGSANPGWRGPLPRQETLAVPELSGSCQINLAVPMLSGAWALPARKTWQCQRSVAPHLANSRFSPHPSSAAPLPRPLNGAVRGEPLLSGRHRTAAHGAPAGQPDAAPWGSDIECTASNTVRE